MKPIEAYYKIREACLRRPELKYKDDFFESVDLEADKEFSLAPFMGYCYVATLVFCHLVPEAIPYTSEDKRHYFARIDEKIWDLTSEQFQEIPDYEKSRRVPRKSKLTKRAQLLLEEVMLDKQ